MNAIEIKDLTVAYDSKPVLWDIELKIPQSKLAAIIGPNGAGKTTLVKSLLGLVKPVMGQVEIMGNQQKIAYVPQTASVDWDFPTTALDVVMMGRYGHLGFFKRPGKKEKALAGKCLEKVGMEAFASRQISQLSGGQQQRVFLARALAQDAEIYLLDEPLKGVDAKTEAVIMELLKGLQRDGKTVIVVHHDLRTVEANFDWVVLLNTQLVGNGPVKDIFTKENLEQTYQMDRKVG
ncbi:MAG: metal ABC transporter ATP-binding protein [Turicibacter sp.]|nr:metal ABC transporter ATP-binding protein [Turicibacter sp.]